VYNIYSIINNHNIISIASIKNHLYLLSYNFEPYNYIYANLYLLIFIVLVFFLYSFVIYYYSFIHYYYFYNYFDVLILMIFIMII